MSLTKSLTVTAFVWVAAITGAHVAMNLPKPATWFAKEKKMKIGFLPVTCHLTCPVTDFINKEMQGEGFFEPMKFSGFPELKESFISGDLRATFILAPMAIALREQGVPIKIVYLGHRDGTALMVHKDSNIRSIADLRGKTVAVPSRFSNQRLLIFRALKANGMTIKDINLIEIPPPDMPAALYSKSVDAVTSGEPFMAQCELDGYGRVLYLTKDIWPNFISCVLAVNEAEIRDHPEKVQQLVDGIVRQAVGIVGVGIPARNPEHPLRDEVLQRVRDARRDAAIGEAARQRLDQTEAGVGRLQQDRAAIRTRVGLIERRHQRAIEQMREEHSLWYRVVAQRKRLRCGERSLSTAFVPRGGVCISTESQSVMNYSG